MSDAVPTAGITILCDRYGTILHILCEDVGLADRFAPRQSFATVVDEGSREKAYLFLTLLQTQGAASDWELNVLVNGQLVTLYCAGGATPDGLVIVGAQSRSGMIQLYEESLNKQAQAVTPNVTEHLQQAYVRAKREGDLYNELSRLNNELVTLQRELTKKNIELRTQREWFRVTLCSIGDAVIATDPDGHVTFLNPVAQVLTGWQLEDAVGKPFTEVFRIVNRETRRPAEAPIRRVLRKGGVTGLANDTILVAKTGTEIPIDDSAAPIKDDKGAILGVVIVFRDVTARAQFEEALHKANDELERRVQERTANLVQANRALQAEIAGRKRAEDKLRESERLATIGTTTAKLAHEIGNPLNGMYTTMQLLERYVARQAGPLGGTLVSTVQDLMTETNRLRSLLQELRALSRPHKLDLQPLALAATVEEVLAIEAPQYTEQGIRVERDFPPNLPVVMADGERLKQVVLNLCKNAVEAMPEGGTLTLRGYTRAEEVCLEVQDTGCGIPEGVEIFEPFATTKSNGTGLGLAVVKQIVAAHNGTIAYSSAREKGTTFTLALPFSSSRTKGSTTRQPQRSVRGKRPGASTRADRHTRGTTEGVEASNGQHIGKTTGTGRRSDS